MGLRFKSLGSGSAGNATLIEAKEGVSTSYILVDCGMPLRTLITRLQQAGIEPEQIDAIFITHEHVDHTGCVEQLVPQYRIPVWMSKGTAMSIPHAHFEEMLNLTRDGDTLEIANVQLQPYTVPHDAREPLQLRCSDGDKTLGIATDLGHCTEHVIQHLLGCHALLIESNHDPEMLAAGNYPAFLKRRIAGQFGHLSNQQAAQLLQTVQHRQLGHVLAAHLSESNNRAELAVQALSTALQRAPEEVNVADSENGSTWLTV